MMVIFTLVIVLLVTLHTIQNERIRQGIADLFSPCSTKLIVQITFLALMTFSDSKIHPQLRKPILNP